MQPILGPAQNWVPILGPGPKYGPNLGVTQLEPRQAARHETAAADKDQADDDGNLELGLSMLQTQITQLVTEVKTAGVCKIKDTSTGPTKGK